MEIMNSHFRSYSYIYGDDADKSESSARLRHCFEWMLIRQSGRVMPWEDFEVVRVSRKPGSLLSLTSAQVVFKTGVRVAESRFPLVPTFLRSASIPVGLALPPLLSLRLYAHFVGRRLRKLPTMPPGKELSAMLCLKRRWERLVGLEFCWSLLHCAVLERRYHARVPILPADLLEFIVSVLPPDALDIPYPGGQHGTPRDTLNELVQAAVVDEGRRTEVNVPLSSEPVVYVSLDVLFETYKVGQGARSLLPIENGALVPPGIKAAMEAGSSKAAFLLTPATEDVRDGDGMVMQTPLVPASSGAVPQPADEDSSPIGSLSPVRSLHSDDLSPLVAGVDEEEEIQPVTPCTAREISSKFQGANRRMEKRADIVPAPRVALRSRPCPSNLHRPTPRMEGVEEQATAKVTPPISSCPRRLINSSSEHRTEAKISSRSLGSTATEAMADSDNKALEKKVVSVMVNELVGAAMDKVLEAPANSVGKRMDTMTTMVASEAIKLPANMAVNPVADRGSSFAPNPDNRVTEVAGDIAAQNSSLAPASRTEDERLKVDVATVERVSRNGGVEHVDGRVTVVPLHVVTNMRISVSDLFRDYPGWRVPLAEYVNTPWKIVALRDACQRVAGWIRNQDPNSERRGPRGGSGWRTKATLAESANRTLTRTNNDLVRRLGAARADADDAAKESRRLREEQGRMLSEISALRRGLASARSSCEDDRAKAAENVDLRAERDRLRGRLEDSERENHSLLREMMVQRRRRSPFSSRSPSPKRRRRSDGGWRDGSGW